jgi:hypothetical protein
LLLALGDEGDAVAARAPARLAVLVAAGASAARRAAQRGQQPQRAARLLSSIEKRVTAATACAPSGRQAGRADALERQRCRRVGFLLLGPWAGRPAMSGFSGALTSCQSRCARTVGHSAAVML